MPVFESIEKKITFLKKVGPRQFLEAFDYALREYYFANLEDAHLPPASLDALTLNLSFCFFKNLRWCSLDLFQEIAAAMLVDDFRFSNSQSELFIEHLVERMGALSPQQFQARSEQEEREFLRYIIVNIMASKHDEGATAELGLGNGILRKVNAAAQLIDILMAKDESAPTSTVQFVPELDSSIAHVMIELAEQQEECPWILDIYRLKYALESSADDPWWVYSKRFGISNIYNMLLEIGTNGPLLEKAIAQVFASFHPEDVINRSFTDFMQHLCDKGLIFCFSGQNDSPGKRRWTLSERAFELSATAFATHADAKELDAATIGRLNAHYQAAYFEHHFKNAPSLAKETLAALGFRISPKALAVCFKALQENSDTTEHVNLVDKFLSNNATPWQRKTACLALASSTDEDKVRHLLQKMAESDASALVKGAALEELIKREKIFREVSNHSELQQQL